MVIVAGVISGVFVKRHQDSLVALQTNAYNDSIQSMITSDILVGDSLFNLGNLHEEGFEVALLDAYQNYNNAISHQFKDGSTYKEKADINKKIQQIERQLFDAYISFKEKAVIFSDEKEIADEFEDRAKAISDVIDVTKYQTN